MDSRASTSAVHLRWLQQQAAEAERDAARHALHPAPAPAAPAPAAAAAPAPGAPRVSSAVLGQATFHAIQYLKTNKRPVLESELDAVVPEGIREDVLRKLRGLPNVHHDAERHTLRFLANVKGTAARPLRSLLDESPDGVPVDTVSEAYPGVLADIEAIVSAREAVRVGFRAKGGAKEVVYPIKRRRVASLVAELVRDEALIERWKRVDLRNDPIFVQKQLVAAGMTPCGKGRASNQDVQKPRGSQAKAPRKRRAGANITNKHLEQPAPGVPSIH
eukprot:m51a1_g9017 hypothetical protein (275) ;mRNA; f:174763-175706